MGHTYTALHYHIVFATKDRALWIKPEVQTRLYDYIGGVVRGENGVLIAAGGMRSCSSARHVAPHDLLGRYVAANQGELIKVGAREYPRIAVIRVAVGLCGVQR